MNKERREYIYEAVFLNCVMTALAIVAFAVSLWLVAGGRVSREGADATFLCAAGFVAGCAFASVPLLSVRDGLLVEVRELIKAADRERASKALHEGAHQVPRPARRRAPAWRETTAH